MSQRSSTITGRLAGMLALASLATLGACVDGADAPDLVTTPGTGVAELGRIYRLGAGDKLKITVFGEQDLSGSYEVSATGNVALPLVGDIPVQGRAISDFRAAVATRLAQGYLKNPKVTVEILTYRPIYVHGEVKQGGEHPYKSGIKVRDAVALAGGYTYRANTAFVLITREGQYEEAKVRLPSDLDILPGDNIRVPERLF